MKVHLLMYLTAVLLAPIGVWGQDSFTVALASNLYSNFWNTPTSTNPNNAGYNFIVSGYLYPGDYFDTHCPDKKDCGILLETVFDPSGNPSAYLASPEDDTLVIGDWDCRSYIIGNINLGAVNGEESIGEISTQTFNFYAHPRSPCPQGCYIVTEGYLDGINNKRRSIAGGTQAFQAIRGDLNWIYLPLENTGIQGYGRNATGKPNLVYNFKYGFPQIDQHESLSLDVSLKKHTLIMSDGVESYNPEDSTAPFGKFGSAFSIEGIIYKGGTFEKYGFTSGINPDGTAQWKSDSIGTWIARGSWISKLYDFDDGFFASNKQTLLFKHPQYGIVQITTESEGDITMNMSIDQAVIGATGSLFGYVGTSTQKMVGKNASDGWNFSYVFDIGGKTTKVNEAEERSIALKVFPNPANDYLSVVLDEMPESGGYALEVCDVTGKVVLQRQLETPARQLQYKLSIQMLPPGWYRLIVKHEGHIIKNAAFTKF